MKHLTTPSSQTCHENGAALIVGLVFLVMLTMLGITAIQTSTLEERMAGNARDVSLALQSAEMALRQGEAQINARSEQTATSTGYYDVESTSPGPAPDPSDSNNWTIAKARLLTGITFVTGTTLSAPPLLWIEKQPNSPLSVASMKTVQVRDVEPFYVTAHSTGSSGSANVTLQSAFRRMK